MLSVIIFFYIPPSSPKQKELSQITEWLKNKQFFFLLHLAKILLNFLLLGQETCQHETVTFALCNECPLAGFKSGTGSV